MKDTYLKSKKVLIVDDEESLRSMLITILEDENFFNIITADCVKSALEICQQEKPDIQETSLLTQKARVPRIPETEVIPLIPSRITVILTGRR